MFSQHDASRRAFGLIGVMLILSVGCSTSHYRKSADDEVYDIIGRKQEEAGLPPSPFTIDPAEDPLRERLLERLSRMRADAGIEGELPERLSGPNSGESQPTVEEPEASLTLRECLESAAENSRDYQREKENVYLAALNLTFERHAFKNRYFGTVSSDVGQTLPEERSGTIDADTGFSRLLASGAEVFFDVGTTLFTAFTGGAKNAANSLLSFSITQPLLRGAGRSIAQEPLTQSERDALYAIRSFERFKRTLAVRVASEMYQVLQQLDSVENAEANYRSLIRSRELIEALAQAGRTPEFEVDQARQDELRARDRWIQQLQQYESDLDRFKITLGLPTDAKITIDPQELDLLSEAGLVTLGFELDAAQAFALDNRLDLQNSRDVAVDAGRRVDVAEDALRAGFSVSLSSDVANESNVVAGFAFGDGTYLFGADLDLPLDRKSERNAYRAALIALESERREAARAEDTVKLQVRQAMRSLAQEEESYRIQRAALELANRRVESTRLLQQAGRLSTRDVLEATEALLETQDGLTSALINHTIARLELLRDMGLLSVDQKGLSYDASTPRDLEKVGP